MGVVTKISGRNYGQGPAEKAHYSIRPDVGRGSERNSKG
jgi:hypothetical protein